MPLAGDIIEVGRIPGWPLPGTILTTDSPTFTSEAVVATLIVPVVSGRTYRVKFWGLANSTVTGNTVLGRIREDTLIGTQLQQAEVEAIRATTTSGTPLIMEVPYTAVSTGNKTFVATGQIVSGGGTGRIEADVTRPAVMDAIYWDG